MRRSGTDPGGVAGRGDMRGGRLLVQSRPREASKHFLTAILTVASADSRGTAAKLGKPTSVVPLANPTLGVPPRTLFNWLRGKWSQQQLRSGFGSPGNRLFMPFPKLCTHAGSHTRSQSQRLGEVRHGSPSEADTDVAIAGDADAALPEQNSIRSLSAIG